MITKNDLIKEYGEDIILLFKGDEPFTEGDNNSPLGMLIEKDGKIICNECKNWFETLGFHLKHAHNLTAREYKIKYGMNLRVGLCNKKLSEYISKRMTETMKHRTSAFKNESVRKLGPKINSTKQRINSIQRRNSKATCPEQIKERINLLMLKFGDEFSIPQAREYDHTLVDYAKRVYGSWNKMKEAFGIKPCGIGRNRKKNKANLIYDLRKYVETYGSLPFYKNNSRENLKLNGFLYSKITYINHFGSMLKTYATCGIKKIGRNKFEVIN